MLKKMFSLTGMVLLCTILAKQAMSGEGIRPRGVRPDLGALYAAGRDFQCIDGSATIPFDQVNDDFCDCRDGSDEPGTSACPNSSFYCPNKGFRPTVVFSSRVNDGICDCCDGSDEWALDSLCANTCEEMGAADRLERERLSKLAQEGLRVKAELIQRGKEIRDQKRSDLASKTVLKEEASVSKDAKRALKEEAEAPEKEALDNIRAEEEKQKQAREEQEKKEKEEKANTFFQKLDLDQNGEVTKSELAADLLFDQNQDGQVSEEEALFYLAGQETFTKENFYDNGWPIMSHLTEASKPSEPSGELDEGQQRESEDYDYDNENENAGESDDDLKAPEPVTEKPSTGTSYDEATQLLIDRATAARREYDEADRAFRDLERDVEELEKFVNTDFGKDDVFVPMAKECYEYTDLEYTYKLCAFDSCSQRPKNGGGETRLGTWGSWSGPESDRYSHMTYSGGSQCWNGPQRSAKVNLKCGQTNAVTSVTEPSRCEYLFVFETPAACNEEDVQVHTQLHDEL